MATFENHQEFFSALDSGLRRAHETGISAFHKFSPQRAKLEIESLEPPVEFEFYTEDMPGRLLVPRVSGMMAVVAMLPRDEERNLSQHYVVVEKKDKYYGVPADYTVISPLAIRCDVAYTNAPKPPAVEEDELSRTYAKQDLRQAGLRANS